VAARVLLRSGDGEPIDDAVVLWFPAPASATGEDVAEFHVHGGRAVLSALFAALGQIESVRPAEPGEFTRRAFENGKLDLTEAEGLDDLIHADTDRQRRQALRQLKGLLGDRARDWRERIIAASALIEAGIDFSDEGDVPAELTAPALARIEVLLNEIDAALAAGGRTERLREGLLVAIAGPPNVGKSTLMNQLAQREVAIVSPHAGTTRDIIEVHLDLSGYPVTVIDTAGIRCPRPRASHTLLLHRIGGVADADLVLWLTDGSGPADVDDAAAPIWSVQNKIDLVGVGDDASGSGAAAATFRISAKRGDGLTELIAAIVEFAEVYFGANDTALIGRERQRKLLQETALALRRALDVIGEGEELAAEELRRASTSLGRLLGRVDVEDILDVIFREFCIGK